MDSIGFIGSILFIIIWLLWLIGGLAAFITSIICFSYKSGDNQNLIGLLLALFFGPFYWFYYAYSKSYCNN
jgi:hypothetical protein